MGGRGTSSSQRVVLVTGSRDWTDRDTIRSALVEAQPSIVIHGGARGADRIADEEARKLGIHVACVDALWTYSGNAAGPLRNKAMLLLQPAKVLAFPLAGSFGTKHMVKCAEAMGIPVQRFSPWPE